MTTSLQGELEILILLDWYDGPLEGVLRGGGDPACWHFNLFAERLETNLPDDRLFALRRLSDADSLVLGTEFGFGGTQHWPANGGLGSPAARRIVGRLRSAPPVTPDLILRTPDFITASETWTVPPADRYGTGNTGTPTS